MNDFRIQTGLRIPENQYERLKAHSERMGVSLNSMMLTLIDIGLNYLPYLQEEFPHESSHSQKDSS